MNRAYLRATRDAEARLIVKSLQQRQFTHPHEPIQRVMSHVAAELGIYLSLTARAVGWLQLDAQQSIGRLRQCEIFQLARTLQRLWRQNALRSGTIIHPTPSI